MNIRELNAGTFGSLSHYIEAALPLTVVTIWIIVAYQSRFVLREDKAMWKKFLWPIALLLTRPQRPEDDRSCAV